jgi:hypothetical protein
VSILHSFSFLFFFCLFERLLEVEKSGRLGIWSEFASRRRSFLFGLRSLSDVYPNGLHFRIRVIIREMMDEVGKYKVVCVYRYLVNGSRLTMLGGIVKTLCIICIILCTAIRHDPAEETCTEEIMDEPRLFTADTQVISKILNLLVSTKYEV